MNKIVVIISLGIASIHGLSQERCIYFGLPQNMCTIAQTIPDTSYQNLMSTGGVAAITNPVNCTGNDCIQAAFRDECDLCDSDVCRKFCIERRSTTKELFSFVKDLVRRTKKSRKHDSGENHIKVEQKTITVTKEETKALPQTTSSLSTPPPPQSTPPGNITNQNTNTSTACSERSPCSSPPEDNNKPKALNCAASDEKPSDCKALYRLLAAALKKHSKDIMKNKKSRVNEESESEEKDEDEEDRKSPKSTPDHVTVTRYLEKTKTIERPVTLYREFTTTLTKEKPIINYKVTTLTEKGSTVTKYETITTTIEATAEAPKVPERVKTSSPPKANEDSEVDDYKERPKPKKPKRKRRRVATSEDEDEPEPFIMKHSRNKGSIFERCSKMGNTRKDSGTLKDELRRICKKLFSDEKGRVDEDLKTEDKKIEIVTKSVHIPQERTITVEKTVEKTQEPKVTTTQVLEKTITLEKQPEKPASTTAPKETIKTVTVEKQPEKSVSLSSVNQNEGTKTVTIEKPVEKTVLISPERLRSEVGKTVTQILTVTVPDTKTPPPSVSPVKSVDYQTILIPKEALRRAQIPEERKEPEMNEKPCVNILQVEDLQRDIRQGREQPLKMVCEDRQNRKFKIKKVGNRVKCYPSEICSDPTVEKFVQDLSKNTNKEISASAKGKKIRKTIYL